MNGDVILNSKVKGQGHCERKYNYRFSHISSSKVNQFTSNQDQNEQRPIIHGSSKTFLQRDAL